MILWHFSDGAHGGNTYAPHSCYTLPTPTLYQSLSTPTLLPPPTATTPYPPYLPNPPILPPGPPHPLDPSLSPPLPPPFFPCLVMYKWQLAMFYACSANDLRTHGPILQNLKNILTQQSIYFVPNYAGKINFWNIE